MDAKFQILEASMPQKTSNTEAWIAFWNLIKEYYGPKMAVTIFAIAWKERGSKDATADVVKLRTATGVPLDNQSVLDSAETVAKGGLSLLESVGTTYKYVMYAGIGIVLVLVGGLVIRVITASASEIGTVAGTAVKAAA
jgi:hypothetical protein